MTEYTIAAIPTIYRGRQYRSRLEARWAAFFDRLGWTHEYEPFDLGKWSPDFAITKPFDALVEVKPATEFDPVIAEKMHDAVGPNYKGFLFLTRVAPILTELKSVELGWWATSYQEAALAWTVNGIRPILDADIFSWLSDRSRWITATGAVEEPGAEEQQIRLYLYPDFAMRLWADACNAVQWEPNQ